MSEEFVEIESAYPFTATLERLAGAIESHGMSIFTRIDHAKAAQAAGLSMPPTVVLLYGNPNGGTPVMQAAPRAALDLPLRVLVREDGDGRVLVGFHPASVMLARAGVPEPLTTRLNPAQAILGEAIKGLA